MRFLLIDTNIYLGCALLQKSDHDSKLIGCLSRGLRQSGSIVLLPEIIESEFDRKQSDLFRKTTYELTEIQDRLKAVLSQLGMTSERTAVLQYIERVNAKRERNLADVRSSLARLFTSRYVKRLPVTNGVVLATFRRSLTGRHPFNVKKSQHPLNADCAIVESVLEFFVERWSHGFAESDTLAICSDNIEDFAQKDASSGQFTLHPDISQEFNGHPVELRYYRSLPEMLWREFGRVRSEEEIAEFEKSCSGSEPSNKNPETAPGLYFEFLENSLDWTAQFFLDHCARDGGEISLAIFHELWQQTFPVVQTRTAALNTLRTGRLIQYNQDESCLAVTDLGRQFLEHVRWLGQENGYRPRGWVPI